MSGERGENLKEKHQGHKGHEGNYLFENIGKAVEDRGGWRHGHLC